MDLDIKKTTNYTISKFWVYLILLKNRSLQDGAKLNGRLTDIKRLDG